MVLVPVHETCHHLTYTISCAEYEALIAVAGGSCQICGTNAAKLSIDHDHEIGRWAVRGLLCHACNMGMMCIDSRSRTPDDRVTSYLAGAWYLANCPAERNGRRRCPSCHRYVLVRLNGSLYAHNQPRYPGDRCAMSGNVPAPVTPGAGSRLRIMEIPKAVRSSWAPAVRKVLLPDWAPP